MTDTLTEQATHAAKFLRVEAAHALHESRREEEPAFIPWQAKAADLIDAQAAALARMRRALEQVEWFSGAGKICPWCRAYYPYAHFPDCPRQRALAVGSGA